MLMRKTIRFKQSDIKVKLGEYDFDQVSVISSVQDHLIVNRHIFKDKDVVLLRKEKQKTKPLRLHR